MVWPLSDDCNITYICIDTFMLLTCQGLSSLVYYVCYTPDTIDREMMSEHVFHVTATDGGGEYMTVTYTIQIVDENDNPPRYIMGNVHTIILYEDREVRSCAYYL